MSAQIYADIVKDGLSKYRQGNLVEARSCFFKATEIALKNAKTSSHPFVIRNQYKNQAAYLLSMVKRCKTVSRKEKIRDEESSSSNWEITEKPNIKFDDISGLDEVKEEIKYRMVYPFKYPQLAQKYQIGVGGGVLFYGPPGTGKTMLAKAVASEIDASFFSISPAQIMSKWVGDSEQNIKKLFDEAKTHSKSVIFIDEIESLVPKRTSGGSTVMQRVVPQILQEVEGFDRSSDRCLLILGATNKPWMIDDAMLRPGRFDFKIYIGLPDSVAIHSLIETYVMSRPVSEDVDPMVLCDLLKGYSGADIKSIAEKSSKIVFMEAVSGKEERCITMQDLQNVIKGNPPSVNQKSLTKYFQWQEENG